MKFIADVMLGRLAKRLRLRGYDVLYRSTFDDNEIIRLSLEQGRIILTRDAGLAARPLASGCLFIANDHVQEQVCQVLSSYPGEESPLTRCSLCNEPLVVVEKPDAKDRVPEYVFDRTGLFQECGSCGRVYWKGTHVRRMGLGK